MTGTDHGIILCNKPPGITSSDLVLRARRSLGIKTGHAGTLDKFAEGLMILLAGSASSFSSVFLEMDKLYEAVFQFGRFTDTHDPEGEILDERSEAETRAYLTDHAAEISEEVTAFEAESEQIPPVYSALKIEGRRYSDLARRSVPVLPAPRPVKIIRSELLSIDLDSGSALCRFEVGSGTYIRAIARDLSQRLNYPLHIRRLTRLSIGPFLLQDASPADGPYRVLPIGECLEWPAVVVTDAQKEWVRVGRPFEIPLPREGSDLFLKDAAGRVLAWAVAAGGSFRYRRVFLNDRLDGI